jgi:hypothetical protein
MDVSRLPRGATVVFRAAVAIRSELLVVAQQIDDRAKAFGPR